LARALAECLLEGTHLLDLLTRVAQRAGLR